MLYGWCAKKILTELGDSAAACGFMIFNPQQNKTRAPKGALTPETRQAVAVPHNSLSKILKSSLANMQGHVRLQNQSDWHKMTYHSETDDTVQIDAPPKVIKHISGAAVVLKMADGREVAGFASPEGLVSNVDRIS